MILIILGLLTFIIVSISKINKKITNSEENTLSNEQINMGASNAEIIQQHYYIVKEIQKDKLSDGIISSNDCKFINKNLYTSKTEALLFYNNQVSNSANNHNTILEYELYIVNDVFFDSISRNLSNSVSNDDIKKYLLIDRIGKIQNEGTNFETYALNEASKKMITNDITFQNNNSSNYIRTNNSFLDGNYKD